MKLFTKLIGLSLLSHVYAVTLSLAEQTPEPSPTVSSLLEPREHHLDKRIKDVIINKDYAKNQAAKTATTSSDKPPSNWVRTVNGRTEIVHPTVIAGITISAKPPKTTDGLEVWVSLKNDGSPKVIKPELKNGRTKKGRPDYSTYFQTAVTKVYNKEELKAHNMKEDELFTEVIHIEEADLEDHLLNPLIRCTPERYKKTGLAKDKSTEPFCTPKDDERLIKDKTYFVTWYSRFFDPSVEKVRIHLNNVKESYKQKGFRKRNLLGDEEEVEDEEDENDNDIIDYTPFDKRSKVLEYGGKVQESFFVSDWISNEEGFYPLTILEEWIGNKYEKKVLISIQPDNIPDEEFNVLSNPVVVEFSKGVVVNKEHLVDLKKLDEKYKNRHMGIEIEEGIDYEKYMTIITLPMCVIIAAFGMWIFVTINKVDLSKVKKRKFARERTTHRRIPFVSKKKKDYEALPMSTMDLGETKND
ncbi:hypothetical protein KGF56_002799 [Candida oxycetoniae]|uniref:Protein BIG1 n=1 Tax=Candida oxycetoniae TaxID=497107 RepID=A0AAI9SX65_9ASCO|nr:uncharacterized protein KGF56_002799 [Candida oxycetoniae]KAI3404402.2 hypothetical protein KGF56_002799 [Candida oxycetoniae]